MDTIRRRLAAETASLHAAIDERAAAFAPSAPERLCEYLARGIVPIEAALDRADAVRLLPEWPSRRRGHLLPRPADVAAVSYSTDAEIWGGLYVLEGSRLGAAVLRRSHAALAIHPFFAAEEPFWATFCAHLSAADATLADRDGMIEGANKSYGAFLELKAGSGRTG